MTAPRPFVGLRPFRNADQDVFFGRENQVIDLLRRLAEKRFVAVLGPSGSGKSSLVRAGLLPALRAGAIAEVGPTREVVLLRPGSAPIAHLAQSLVEQMLGRDDGESGSDVVAGQIEATLRRSSFGLRDLVASEKRFRESSLVVVVDQFEELFRFSQRQEDADAINFVQLLLEASQSQDDAIYVVLTMRSDFVGDCTSILGLAEALNQSLYLVPRLSRDECRETIEGPLRVSGDRIAPSLVQRLLNEVGNDPDQLPILQHALLRTYQAWARTDAPEIDHSHYESIGGIGASLDRHAEEIYARLKADDLGATVARVFKCLTKETEYRRFVRRPCSLQEISAVSESEPDEVIEIIDAFREPDASFLMPPYPIALDENAIIDIAHEAFIRGWSRLGDWTRREGESARTYRRLCGHAMDWGAGRAPLLTDHGVDVARQWLSTERPTPQWAQRYGGNFSVAMGFLDASEDQYRRTRTSLLKRWLGRR